jgi:hypothetical protein
MKIDSRSRNLLHIAAVNEEIGMILSLGIVFMKNLRAIISIDAKSKRLLGTNTSDAKFNRI